MMMTVEPSVTRRGKLNRLPPAAVLTEIKAAGDTGRLTASRGDARIDIMVHDGDPVSAVSNDPDRRLGELLLRDGKIRFQDYVDSVQALLETGQKQGEYLVARERLSPNELNRAVAEHSRELIEWFLEWEDGEFSFRPGERLDDDSALLKISCHELVLRGMSKCERFSRIRDTLTPWQRICEINPTLSPDDARRVRLKADELSVVRLVDGHRTIAEVVETVPLNDFRAMQLLYGLFWACVVRFRDSDLTENDDFEDQSRWFIEQD